MLAVVCDAFDAHGAYDLNAPYHKLVVPQEIFCDGTMPKKSKLTTLHVRRMPADLLERINMKAAGLGVERDSWLIVILGDEVRSMEAPQAEIKEEWQVRLAGREFDAYVGKPRKKQLDDKPKTPSPKSRK